MTRAPLDSFETALLTELRQEVATRATSDAVLARPRRLVALGAAAATAAALTVGGFGLRPDAALGYSVEPQADGDVVVTISSIDAADELEQALAAEGIKAELMTGWEVEPEGDAGADTDIPEQLPDVVPDSACVTDITRNDDGSLTFRVSSGLVGSDEVLEIGLAEAELGGETEVLATFSYLPSVC